VIRTLSISCLAVGFILAAVQCLCVMPVEAETCHVRPAESYCCCAGNDGSVTNEPAQLPPALAAASPRISGADVHTVLQSTGSNEILPSPRRDGYASSAASVRALPPVYVMNASFLI
jgi:hypothetical protein